MRAVFGVLSAFALAACGSIVELADGGSGLENGQPLSELTLAEFDAVSLHGPDNVEITLGDSFDIRAEGDDDVVSLLEFEIRDGKLLIGRERNSSFSMHDDRATVFVTLPALNAASLMGSGDMRIDRAESEDFEASIAGSGSITIAALTASHAEFDIAGSGDIRAGGTVGDLDIGIAGSGDIEADDLRVERAEVDIAGSGNVELYATEEVRGSLLGSGDVRVRGGASCNANSIGSGDIRCN